jgi:hypothetical protein
VRVLMGKVFPYDSGYMQTVTGRRKRLRAVLEPLLAESGWREIRRDVYSKASSSETHGQARAQTAMIIGQIVDV